MVPTQREKIGFSGRGEVYSFSIVYSAPAEFEEFVPYIVALIRLKDGPLVTAQLTDVSKSEVFIGMRVEMVTRVLVRNGDQGLILYGYKFRPVLESSDPLETTSS